MLCISWYPDSSVVWDAGFWSNVASFFKETVNGLQDWQLATQRFTTPAIQFFAQSPRVARLLKESLSHVIQGPHHKTTPWTLLTDYSLCSCDFWTHTNVVFAPKIQVICFVSTIKKTKHFKYILPPDILQSSSPKKKVALDTSSRFCKGPHFGLFTRFAASRCVGRASSL